MIGRGNGNNRPRIFTSDPECSIGNAWGGIPPERFGKNPVGPDAKLLNNKILMFSACNYINIPGRTNIYKPVVGLLYQAPSRSGNIKELFWLFQPAERPETAANSSSHYQDIPVIHSDFFVVIATSANILFIDIPFY
jgi:hypothetical protein